MKKSTFILWLSLCLSCIQVQAEQPAGKQIPDYPTKGGISAPFAGFIGNWLIVGGGCNFPGTPAAEGGKKAFYETVYALDISSDTPKWISLPALPHPSAYGATVSTNKGLVCIGGQTAETSLSDAFLIRQDGNESFSIIRLPSLPETIDNAAAACIGSTIYITGGNQQDQSNRLYKLDLNTPDKWLRLASFPGVQRVQPVLLATDESLFLAGGFENLASPARCILSDNILKYDIRTDTWSEYDTIVREKDGGKRCLVGGSGVTYRNRLILTGGVCYELFKAASEGKAPKDYMKQSPEWYRFNDDILIYDYETKQWSVHYDVPGMAKAGGILLLHENLLYMVCGEIKPGVRTPQVITCPIP